MPHPTFKFLPLGAIIQEFYVKETNIVQGFPKQEQYVAHNVPFFGETIGRVANRIKGARIESLNGAPVLLAQNDGENTLHGGHIGWGKKVWDGPKPVTLRNIPGIEDLVDGESVEFTLKDPSGNEGFPGTLHVSVVYTTASLEAEDGKMVRVLGIEYQAVLADDDDVQETMVNITNHSYFNLGASPTIEGTVLSISTSSHLPLDETWIPISGPNQHPSIRANEEFTLGQFKPAFNECFIVTQPEENIPLDTRTSPLKLLVSAYSPDTKIHLEILSTEPAFQFYTGDYIDVKETAADAGVKKRGARSGFCVEPSRYINAVNVPEWKGQVLLKKGDVYGSWIVYKGWYDE